jgi:hypothetical protein
MGEQPPSSPEGSAVFTLQAVLPSPRELWSVVVQGAMDPRQHHPFWYKTIGCLSENELLRTQGIVLPTRAQFTSPQFAIECTPSRWDIQTYARDDRLRMLQVTSKVFQKLYEVPVGAFGINAHLFKKTAAPSVKAVLSRVVIQSLPFPPEGETDASITFVSKTAEYATNCMVGEAVTGNDVLFVSFNRHYAAKGDAGGYFDLGPDVRKHADRDWADADVLADGLAARIGQIARD